jgi:hypothetical protein
VEVAGGMRGRHRIFPWDAPVIMRSPLNGSRRQKRCEQRGDR